jgi:hypothetical protein
MITEQGLERYDRDNNSVKTSNVEYQQTNDNNAPNNFFIAIFCGSSGSGKTCLTLIFNKKYLNY